MAAAGERGAKRRAPRWPTPCSSDVVRSCRHLHHAQLRARYERAAALVRRIRARTTASRRAPDRQARIICSSRIRARNPRLIARRRAGSLRPLCSPARPDRHRPGAENERWSSTTSPRSSLRRPRLAATAIIVAHRATRRRRGRRVHPDQAGSDDVSIARTLRLIDQWGVGRAGFDDGLAIMWNTNRRAAPGATVTVLRSTRRRWSRRSACPTTNGRRSSTTTCCRSCASATRTER